MKCSCKSSPATERRFQRLWERLAPGADPRPVWRALREAYGAPYRAYHDLRHVAHCLTELDGARGLTENDDRLEAALWFHDAVYDPAAPDNEARSAIWATAALIEAGASASLGRAVAELIVATRHAEPPTTDDERLVVDIDLAVLGQPARVFDDYERRIRSEYGFVPDEDFRKGRARILRSFLDRGHVFWTPCFRRRYEAAAKRNLKRSLARLEAPARGAGVGAMGAIER